MALHWADASQAPPDTLLLLGFGQIGRIPQWVAKEAGSGVIVAEGLPYWHASASRDAMLALVQSYCHAVLEEVLARFALEKINLVAGSQSTVGAVLLANERPKQIGNIALMCPQGLTVQALGASGAERLREFKKRALLSFRQKPNTPLGDWRNGYIWLASERIGLRTRKVFAQQFSDGIAYDLTEPLRGLAAKQKTRGASLELLPGADDKLFPAQEIIDSLAKAGMGDVKLAVVPQAAHSSLAVRGGRPQLAAAIASVRQNNY